MSSNTRLFQIPARRAKGRKAVDISNRSLFPSIRGSTTPSAVINNVWAERPLAVGEFVPEPDEDPVEEYDDWATECVRLRLPAMQNREWNLQRREKFSEWMRQEGFTPR